MKYILLFDHPIIGRVYYGEKGTLTSDGRKVMMIKYNESESCLQGFYRSSGMESGYEGTWFPFDGDVINSDSGEPLLLKLSSTNFASQFKTFVKKTKKSDVQFQKNMIKFGTLTFLYISYILGGGIWNSKAQTKRILGHVPKVYLQNDSVNRTDMEHVKFPKVPQSQKNVNLFLGKAMSFNFLKGTEYPTNFNGDWILDYKDIYNGKMYLFYPNTRISFTRFLFTKCTQSNSKEEFLLDFMIAYDHNNTSLTNFFYPSIHDQSIFENKFCKKYMLTK
jgi:hypothetical protein